MACPSTPLRVLFILPAFYRNGAVDMIVNLSEKLIAYNIDVEILATRQCDRQSHLPKPPVKFDILLEKDHSTLAKLPALLPRIIRSITRSDIIVFTWENRLLLPGLLTYLLKKPSLAIVQNNLQRSSEDYFHRKGERSIRRWIYAQAQAVVCVGSGLIATLESEVDKQKITSIQNGINLEKVRLLAKQPCPPAFETLIEDKIPFIVGVGRLVPQKGFDLLISAHAAVIKQGIQHRLVLIGEGDEQDNLLRLAKELGISDSVVFLGYLSNPYAVLARASLFCLSSRYEGFGLVVAEAAALGIPTITADCVAGPRELLADGLYGDLVETESAEALAIAIKRHLENPPRLQAKAKASEAQANRFSMALCAKRYSELFHKCVSRDFNNPSQTTSVDSR